MSEIKASDNVAANPSASATVPVASTTVTLSQQGSKQKSTLRNSMQERETTTARRAALANIHKQVRKADVEREYDFLFATNDYTTTPLIQKCTANERNQMLSEFLANYGQSLDGRLTAMSDFNFVGMAHTIGAKYASLCYALANGDFSADQKSFYLGYFGQQLVLGLERLESLINRAAKPFFTTLSMTAEARRMLNTFHDAVLEQKEHYLSFLESPSGQNLLKSEDPTTDFIHSDVDLTAALLMYEAQSRVTTRLARVLDKLDQASNATSSLLTALNKNFGDSKESPIDQNSKIEATDAKDTKDTKANQATQEHQDTPPPNPNKASNPYASEQERAALHAWEQAQIDGNNDVEKGSAAHTADNSKYEELQSDASVDSATQALASLAQTTSLLALEAETALNNEKQKVVPGRDTFLLHDLSQIGRLQTSLSSFINADLLICEEEIGFQIGLTHIKGSELIKKYHCSPFLEKLFERGMQRLLTEKIVTLSNKQCELAKTTGEPYMHTTINAETIRWAYRTTIKAYQETGSAADAVLDAFDQIKQMFLREREIQPFVERYRSDTFFATFYAANKDQNNMYGLGLSTFRRYQALMERDF